MFLNGPVTGMLETEVGSFASAKGVVPVREPGTVREVRDEDREQILSIFNHYAINGFAAYAEKPVREKYILDLLRNASAFYVVDSPEGVIGFGFCKPFLPFPAFAKTGELTYFIMPEYLNQGFGSQLLYRLIREARKKGITMLVAHMASWNEEGIRFHKKHGFYVAGRLKGIGTKFDEPFDVVLMQKAI